MGKGHLNVKLVCVRNKFSNEHHRLPKNEAEVLVTEKGFQFISKTTYKRYLNRINITL